MGKLPALTSRDVIQALLKAGFVEHRQRGSHKIFKKESLRVTVPVHPGDLKKGTLRSIIEQAGKDKITMKLPKEFQEIYKLTEALEKKYPGRKFTPDGHLVGSVGEVIAARKFELELTPMSEKGHDAVDKDEKKVEIKLVGPTATRVAFYETSERVIVMRMNDKHTHATVIYDGPGERVSEIMGKKQKNGQKPVSLVKLQNLNAVD